MPDRRPPAPSPARRSRRALLAAALAAVGALAACAGGPPVTETPAPAAGGATAASTTPVPGRTTAPDPWALKTREHLDLWLHGYALLSDDTAAVPLFRPGYRAAMVEARRQANATSGLDVNRDALRARLAANPGLVNGQFVPLYFAGWDELRQATTLFVQAGGDPRRAENAGQAAVIQFLGGSFPSAADREWLRLFVNALEDERTAFYRAHWTREQEARLGVFVTVDTLWRRTALPRLRGFLNNTQQSGGDVMLSVVLGGEGRTVAGRRTENVVAVTYPATSSDAAEVAYVFAHEVTGSLAAQAVADHVTPAQAREGAADRLQSPAAVHAGLALLQRAAPEFADGYARYYLSLAGRPAGGANPQAALAAAFPLPDAIRDAIVRQVEIVLGGI